MRRDSLSMQPETLGFLVDIRDAARFIAEDTSGATYEEFLVDRRMRQVVLYNFMILGEAVNRVRRHDPEIADHISAVQQIVGLRNTLIHGYQAIDYPTVWHAIHVSLPVLQAEVEQLLGQAGVG
jgi:uncharacterized protein with HEPN domain